MDKWKSVWAVIKGDRLSAQKALNRNAVIAIILLLITVMKVVMMRSGKIQFTPFAVLPFGIAIFYCYSWFVARNDKIRRNKLLVIQGKLGLLIILTAAVWFIILLHSIAHPESGAEAFNGRIGYAPGIMAGAFFYFGRHISDFSEKFKMELNKYTTALLAIGIAFEVIIIVKFIEAITTIFERI